jgi:hypothetical protein
MDTSSSELALPPAQLAPSNHLNVDATVNVLDSLVTFYRQQRMWVYRARASMEFATPIPSITTPSHLTLPQSPPPQTTPPEVDAVEVKVEGVDTKARDLARSKWSRRKQRFKLRLEGISPLALKPRRIASKRERPLQILEQFERLMAARMDSCDRVRKMVRNRGD